MPPFVYILRCADRSLYVGHTWNTERRVVQHNDARGGSYTSQRLPVTLVYFEEFDNVAEAVRRERQIKRWTVAKKTALVDGNPSALKSLARRRKR